MSYTKAEKKQMRKEVYDIAKIYKKQLEEQFGPNPNRAAQMEMLFAQAIMEAEFRISLEIHRKLYETEKKALDILVFNEKEGYNSEQVRLGCKNVKINHENRKGLLKLAMSCDAEIGYWQLSN
jgi:hypothetical protein